ncbi:hypothetical protein Q5O89_07050 [Peribacillus frigoritolerans]|nr:hypothetical protein [Peribacillus frigoritolerans]
MILFKEIVPFSFTSGIGSNTDRYDRLLPVCRNDRSLSNNGNTVQQAVLILLIALLATIWVKKSNSLRATE